MLPGVKLVPMSYNSFELIDHSLAVATLTGMTGWEAVVRGKPVLCLGYSSYRICDGVYHINEEKDLIDAIKKIEQNQFLPNQQKVKKYLSLVYENSSPGVLKDFEYEIYNVDKAVNDQSWYDEVLITLTLD